MHIFHYYLLTVTVVLWTTCLAIPTTKTELGVLLAARHASDADYVPELPDSKAHHRKPHHEHGNFTSDQRIAYRCHKLIKLVEECTHNITTSNQLEPKHDSPSKECLQHVSHDVKKLVEGLLKHANSINREKVEPELVLAFHALGNIYNHLNSHGKEAVLALIYYIIADPRGIINLGPLIPRGNNEDRDLLTPVSSFRRRIRDLNPVDKFVNTMKDLANAPANCATSSIEENKCLVNVVKDTNGAVQQMEKSLQDQSISKNSIEDSGKALSTGLGLMKDMFGNFNLTQPVGLGVFISLMGSIQELQGTLQTVLTLIGSLTGGVNALDDVMNGLQSPVPDIGLENPTSGIGSLISSILEMVFGLLGGGLS